MSSILLVEDDKSLNRGISFKLTKEGYNVFTAESINEAREIINSEEIELIVLDVGLPDGSGFDFCSEVRKSNDVLIIFLTAFDEEVDIVTGLDIGADDYITKPFSLMVLISKVNALLRRNTGKKVAKSISSKDIVFYPSDMRLVKKNEEVSLSKTELKLIKYFINNAQQIVTKDQLLTELWDIDEAFIDQNTLAVNIRRLRERIEDNPSAPEYIKTVRGVGYVWSVRCVNK